MDGVNHTPVNNALVIRSVDSVYPPRRQVAGEVIQVGNAAVTINIGSSLRSATSASAAVPTAERALSVEEFCHQSAIQKKQFCAALIDQTNQLALASTNRELPVEIFIITAASQMRLPIDNDRVLAQIADLLQREFSQLKQAAEEILKNTTTTTATATRPLLVEPPAYRPAPPQLTAWYHINAGDHPTTPVFADDRPPQLTAGGENIVTINLDDERFSEEIKSREEVLIDSLASAGEYEKKLRMLIRVIGDREAQFGTSYAYLSSEQKHYITRQEFNDLVEQLKTEQLIEANLGNSNIILTPLGHRIATALEAREVIRPAGTDIADNTLTG
ncbi:hypothetical protein [Pantoea sp. B65]|uniref:hypothetical protein n=1 Tax=Pantoea sp. B65 TaxID=2813359 RepID=UPI0039B373F3